MKRIKFDIRKITYIGMLAAISAVLMILDFPLPVFPSFLKLDFSDLPALIGAFAFGPIAGVAVELVKNLVHLALTTTGGIGELANFIVGAALVIPAGLFYKFNNSRRGALLGMGAGVAVMAGGAALANYFLLIPFFTKFMPIESIIKMCAAIIPAVDSLGKVILLSVVPFNIFKGVLVCFITYIVYKRLSKFFKGRSV